MTRGIRVISVYTEAAAAAGIWGLGKLDGKDIPNN